MGGIVGIQYQLYSKGVDRVTLLLDVDSAGLAQDALVQLQEGRHLGAGLD